MKSRRRKKRKGKKDKGRNKKRKIKKGKKDKEKREERTKRFASSAASTSSGAAAAPSSSSSAAATSSSTAMEVDNTVTVVAGQDGKTSTDVRSAHYRPANEATPLESHRRDSPNRVRDRERSPSP